MLFFHQDVNSNGSNEKYSGKGIEKDPKQLGLKPNERMDNRIVSLPKYDVVYDGYFLSKIHSKRLTLFFQPDAQL